MICKRLKSSLLALGLLISIACLGQTTLSNSQVDWLISEQRQATFLRKDTANLSMKIKLLNREIFKLNEQVSVSETQTNIIKTEYEKVFNQNEKSQKKVKVWQRVTIVAGGVTVTSLLLNYILITIVIK